MGEIIKELITKIPVIKITQLILIVLIIITTNISLRLYLKKFKVNPIKKRASQKKRVSETRFKIIKVLISTLVYGTLIILTLSLIPGFKSLYVSILAGAGIMAMVIGFAAQKTLANIISGISIAIYAPFRIGDRINVIGENGIVEDINLRQTTIKTWDNKRIIIPNSIISEKEVLNYSLKDEKMLFSLDIGIDYTSDIDKAREIILEQALSHEENLIFTDYDDYGELVTKEPYVRVIALADSSVTLRAYFWVKDNSKGYKMRHELLEKIKKEFDKKGIQIPFPHRTIVYKETKKHK